MSIRTFGLTKRLQALAVDIILRLWDHGLYRDNKWLKMVHANWLHHWIDVKTAVTMDDVDRQIEKLVEDPCIPEFIVSEELDGETPLGGEMRSRAPWLD